MGLEVEEGRDVLSVIPIENSESWFFAEEPS
jgi:hypothetical protein